MHGIVTSGDMTERGVVLLQPRLKYANVEEF